MILQRYNTPVNREDGKWLPVRCPHSRDAKQNPRVDRRKRSAMPQSGLSSLAPQWMSAPLKYNRVDTAGAVAARLVCRHARRPTCSSFDEQRMSARAAESYLAWGWLRSEKARAEL